MSARTLTASGWLGTLIGTQIRVMKYRNQTPESFMKEVVSSEKS
tara:strand:- start:122 stop:253 length:132 start_codon:yes stop_codon:yes gene_type:complete